MERLILCGGGHVSLEVAHIARRLEFELVVIDDRSEFASPERFPMAARVVCAPFLEALDALGSRESDYYVILTRGHAHDRDCLEHVLRGKYAYAGMIGSRTKVAAVKAALEAAGIARETLDGVHSPIGLSIGAQTPAEIAVSIAAELVWERARRGPAAAPPAAGESGVLCTITAKRGSAPRGVGTWMLVRPDGSVLGTIGGGAVEHLAVQEAKALWAHGGGPVRRHYDLTPGRPSWAWCAGATSTWNSRCANERDHPVSSEQLSPLQAGPPASGGAAGRASRVAGHPPPNGGRGGGARLCRYR